MLVVILRVRVRRTVYPRLRSPILFQTVRPPNKAKQVKIIDFGHFRIITAIQHFGYRHNYIGLGLFINR